MRAVEYGKVQSMIMELMRNTVFHGQSAAKKGGGIAGSIIADDLCTNDDLWCSFHFSPCDSGLFYMHVEGQCIANHLDILTTAFHAVGLQVYAENHWHPLNVTILWDEDAYESMGLNVGATGITRERIKSGSDPIGDNDYAIVKIRW